MLYVLTGLMYLLNCKIGNKKIGYNIMLVFLFLVLAGSYGTYDTMIYYQRYEDYNHFESFTEPLFTLLVAGLNFIGITAQQFMAITALVTIACMHKFLSAYAKNTSFFFLLFLIFPLTTFFTQLRYLLAVSFVLAFAFPAIISKGKYSIFQYVFVIVLASGFHTGVIAFLAFLPVLFLSAMQIAVLTIILIFLLCNVSFIVKLLSFAQFFLPLDKLEMLSKALHGEGQFGRSLFTFLLSATMLLILLYLKHFGPKKKMMLEGVTNDAFLDFMIKVNILAFIFVPMVLYMSIGFYRIPMTLLLLNYVVIGNLVKSDMHGEFKISQIIAGVTTLLAVLGLFYSQYSSKEMLELVFFPFYEENLYLSWF